MSQRPTIRCDACGYTWNPRGKNYSIKCPHCKTDLLSQGPQELPRSGGCSSWLIIIGLVAGACYLLSMAGLFNPQAVAPPPPERPAAVPQPPVAPSTPPTVAPAAAEMEPAAEPIKSNSTVDPAVAEAERRATEAARKLALARQLIERNAAAARQRFQELIDNYPGTEAAREAAELLSKMK